MADKTQLAMLKSGVNAWNEWRAAHADARPELSGAHLCGLDLIGVDLAGADLRKADLRGTNLSDAAAIGNACLRNNTPLTPDALADAADKASRYGRSPQEGARKYEARIGREPVRYDGNVRRQWRERPSQSIAGDPGVQKHEQGSGPNAKLNPSTDTRITYRACSVRPGRQLSVQIEDSQGLVGVQRAAIFPVQEFVMTLILDLLLLSLLIVLPLLVGGGIREQIRVD